MPARPPARATLIMKHPDTLRSARWFAADDFRSFGHRSRVMQMGYSAADYAGKPVIALINTWSDANQCHSHFKQRVDDVKRGVLQAGVLASGRGRPHRRRSGRRQRHHLPIGTFHHH